MVMINHPLRCKGVMVWMLLTAYNGVVYLVNFHSLCDAYAYAYVYVYAYAYAYAYVYVYDD